MRRTLLLLVLLLLPVSVLGQQGYVTGTALDSIGNTVAGATITVCPQGSPGIPCSPVTASTTSNGQGSFSVGVPLGTYTVTVFRTGIISTSSTVVVAPTNITVANNVTYSGAVTFSNTLTVSGTGTFTGPQTVGKWNGNCIVDGVVNATLAAAITCAGSSGVIEIPMFAVPSFTTATIPVGVTLKFDGPSCLNNSGTLTVNGPIVAPASVIFCGTGQVVLNYVPQPVQILWFQGSDVCVSLANAYAAIPGGNGVNAPQMQLAPAALDSTYSCASSPNLSSLGKAVHIDLGGSTLSYTGTGGTSAAITAISEAAPVGGTATVTATSTLNPGAGNQVAISGYTDAGTCTSGPTFGNCFSNYNDICKVVTSNSSQFTCLNTVTGLNAATTGTATNVVPFFTLDWGASAGSAFPYSGIVNGAIVNGPCITTGGCGNGTIGISIGPVNGGSGQMELANLKIQGFGVGIQKTGGGSGFAVQLRNVDRLRNTIGYQSLVADEGTSFWGGLCEFNTRCKDFYGAVAMRSFGEHIDTNIGVAETYGGGGTGQYFGTHFENLLPGGCNGSTSHYVFGAVNLQIALGEAFDDCTSGTTDWMFNVQNGNFTIGAFGMAVESAGRIAVGLFQNNGGGNSEVHVTNETVGTLTQQMTCPSFNVTTHCTMTGNSAVPPAAQFGKIQLDNAGGAAVDLISSVAPTLAGGTFGTSPSILFNNGAATIRINVGTGGTATAGTVTMPTGKNNWNCTVYNLTAHAGNRADDTVQTSSTTTTVVVQNQTKSTGAAVAWTASDTIVLTGCMAE